MVRLTLRSRLSLVGGLALVLGLLFYLAGSAAAQSAGPHHAGLVIVHADGRVVTACVAFEGERISGLDLLQQAQAMPVVSVNGGGAAVCSLQGAGCPATDCFCSCKAAPCRYWAYFHRNVEGTWAYSGVGAAGWTLGYGDVDAWVWGDGTQAPPALDFAEVCAASPPEVAATATPLPLLTPISTPGPAQSAVATPGSYALFGLFLLVLLALGLRRRA